MGYKFRVVFSGPCAYMPNIVEGGGGTAMSWSVILPDIRAGWPGGDDDIQADRHYPVLLYAPDDFDSDTDPDVILRLKDNHGSYHDRNLFNLNGHRVTFDFPDISDLKIEDVTIAPFVRGDEAEILKLMARKDPLLQSMDWLPSMNWLRQKLQWFGSDNDNYFLVDGYPRQGTIAAHVLVKSGKLVADEIDTVIDQNSDEVPTIWEFRSKCDKPGAGSRIQALAKSIALEVDLEKPASIYISTSTATATLTLKNNKLTDVRGIEIKNRELEEIFLLDGREIEGQNVDWDFRYMYKHAAGYDPTLLNYPIPHKLSPGAGNEVGTCGGNRFSGFAKRLKNDVEKW